MVLKEKFSAVLHQTKPHFVDVDADVCEQIADEFSIGFAEWLLWQDITQRGRNNFVCKDGVQRSTKELLEIYKTK